MKSFLFGFLGVFFVFTIQGQPDTESAGAGSSTTPGSVAWSNPGNITASDNSYASATNGTTETIVANNFGFNIPSSTTIDGIEVNIERYARASNNISQGTWQTFLQPDYISGADAYNTITHNNVAVDAGSNRLLLVVIGIENVDNDDNGGAGFATEVDPVTVTYNGQAMTQIANPTLASSTTRNWIGMFYLLDADLPAGAATANLVITKTRGVTSTVDDPDEYVEMVSVNTFANVNQTFPFTAVSTTATGVNTITAAGALDVTIGDMLVTGATGNSSGNPFTATGAGYTVQTNVCNSNTNPGGTGACMSVGTRAITTTGVADITPTASTGGGNHGRTALIGVVLQGARVFDNAVQIVRRGSITGSDLGLGSGSIGVSWPETDATTTYGSPTEQWGAAWAYFDINDPDFGISFQADANNSTAFIDHISITVYYTATLPINLLHFDVGYLKQKVKCTATVYIDDEHNYTVVTERSDDGAQFHPINSTDFNLGQPSMHTFEVIDPEPFTGLSYYRLKLIDHFEGTFHYSKAKAVFAGEGLISNWKLYPNPAKDVIVVEIPNTADQVQFQLYTATGKVVPFSATEQGKGRFVITPTFGATWQNGVYILQADVYDRRLKGRFVVRQ
ncbi:MAG: T9SS type A sorting domain-containing protein [Flammeovirgaceae bacterium]